MTVKVELPDTVVCAFINYVYVNETLGMSMGARAIDSEDIERGRLDMNRKEDATV